MRPIKFRLIHNKKIVGYEKWYNGHINIHNDYEALPCWLYSNDDEYYCPIFINHRFKDAFTCLHDRNGKEIYESDIVIYPTGLKELVEFFNVHWYYGNCEVIGNIHENPELLETK